MSDTKQPNPYRRPESAGAEPPQGPFLLGAAVTALLLGGMASVATCTGGVMIAPLGAPFGITELADLWGGLVLTGSPIIGIIVALRSYRRAKDDAQQNARDADSDSTASTGRRSTDSRF